MPKKILSKKTLLKENKETQVSFTLAKENLNKYNENYENTMNNIHAMSILMVKQYGRMGYQIKLLEQILTELKKFNERK